MPEGGFDVPSGLQRCSDSGGNQQIDCVFAMLPPEARRNLPAALERAPHGWYYEQKQHQNHAV